MWWRQARLGLDYHQVLGVGGPALSRHHTRREHSVYCLVYVGRDCIASGHDGNCHSVARTEWCSPPQAARVQWLDAVIDNGDGQRVGGRLS